MKNMNLRIAFVLVVSVVAIISACDTKGVATDFANACEAGNDKKTLEVSGFLQPRSSIFCSNRGGRMECPFDLVDAVGSDKKITADIEQGSGANTVDEIPKGFKKEDLKVRDNAGSQVVFGTDRLKLTGKMMIAPAAPGGQVVCLMQVYKIER